MTPKEDYENYRLNNDLCKYCYKPVKGVVGIKMYKDYSCHSKCEKEDIKNIEKLHSK